MPANRNYFQKFPTISYNDYVIRDLSLRSKLTRYISETGLALLPYTIKDDERADSISAFYYEDPYYAWAIYLANSIIDPYAEWPKDYNTFNEYIDRTYGGFEQALDTIVRYESNWASDTTLLTPEAYDALNPEEKKYWDAQFGYNSEIISYYRRPVEVVMLNNRIDQVTVIATNNEIESISDWNIGERLYQYNYLNDVACKSTLLCIDSATDANTQVFKYTNSTSYDISFSSGNNVVFLKTTGSVLPKANVVGTNIPVGTYITSITDGNYVTLSNAPTGSISASDYSIYNPASAVITVNKVDFSDVIFASNTTLAATNSFFTYVKNMNCDKTSNTILSSAYRDTNNYMVGRQSNNRVIVLDHRRIDDPGEAGNPTSQSLNPANVLLANSHLSNAELKYWKSINAYEDEQQKNEQRKEILVLDATVINRIDEELERLLGNV